MPRSLMCLPFHVTLMTPHTATHIYSERLANQQEFHFINERAAGKDAIRLAQGD